MATAIVRTRVRVRQHKHLARVSNDTIVGSVLTTVNTDITGDCNGFRGNA